ncbi:ParB N-terminal domain-containing protein [candidate division WOR-3 bacterium]|nr:ParB N-terminal domain-containing protein [candidate division WOR-3 bacterium]
MNVGKVAMVPIKEIEVGERARKEMGDLDELEVSMHKSGLIAPLAVKETNNGNYFLLAGERRLFVLLKNKVEEIPVRIYSEDISEFEIKTIELAENFFRKDFESHEYDNLVRETHNLQQEIHGEKISTLADAEGWGMKETAEMIGKTKGYVSSAIRRADARDAFPDLFHGCKTQKDANKILDKLNEAVVKDVLAKKIEQESIAPDKQQLMNNFVLKDFFEGVKEIPDESMHLVEIDPPYAINIDGLGKGSSAKKDYSYGGSYNEVDYGDYRNFLAKTFHRCYKVMTEHSWLICWFAPEPWFEDVYILLHDAGFNCHRMCGIWTKSSGQSKRPEIHLANSYEMFFYAWKGRPALAKPGRSNIFNFSPVPPQYKTHPTERPVELMKEIYETFAFPGSRVLIPFLGSGNGLLAAQAVGMSAVGFELSKEYRDSFLVKIYKM